MRRIIFFLTLFLFFISVLSAQNVYIPRDIKAAYESGTRSYDGKPGPNYWQNGSDYIINAELIPDSSKLIGHVDIKYHNNSPDSLRMLVLRLYQNITAKGSPRDRYIGQTELLDPVKIKNLKINENTYDLNDPKTRARVNGTNMTILLKEKIAPRQTVSISMDYSFYIPQIVKIRMGNYNDGEFFVSYWYPQISVYDDIDGWDMLQYTGNVEFYNDFSNYEYNITVPGNFVVWGAGNLTNAEEVYRKPVLERISQAMKSDKTVRIFDSTAHKNREVTTPGNKHTWKFKADNVTDVSFCVSDSYVWDAASVEVDPQTHRRALANAVFEEGTVQWDTAAQYVRATLEYMSKELPGYPYPYPHATSFCNKARGGGMETPMMQNDGAPTSKPRHIGLIFHEIAHTYFPFIMGTNERKYAWMDEGWATFFPREVVERLNPGYNYFERTVRSYETVAGYEMELPMMIPSYSNRGRYARTAFYSKPATAYNELMELLGRDLFKKCLLAYMKRWHGHHPIPYDFFFTFNDVAGEDLSWFWTPWFFESGYPDLAIADVSKNENIYSVKIEKKGIIPTGVRVTFKYEDGTEDVIEKSAREWKDKSTIMINLKTEKKPAEILLGGNDIPDTFRENNYYKFD